MLAWLSVRPGVTVMDALVGRGDCCPGWLESLAVAATGMVMCGADLLKRDALEGRWCLLRTAWWGGVGPLGWEKLWEGIGATYLCLLFLLKLCYCF